MSRGKDCALMLALIGLGIMGYKLKTQKQSPMMMVGQRPTQKPAQVDDDMTWAEDPRFSRFTKQRTSPDKQALQQVTQQMPGNQPARKKSIEELSAEAGDWLDDADPKSLIDQTRSY